MNIKRINFIMSAPAQRPIKRITEFKAMGYEVRAYYFDRAHKIQEMNFAAECIASFPNSLSYLKRLKIYYKGLKRILNDTHRNYDELWFYFGLDVAMFARCLNKNKKYLYEEADMTHTNMKNVVLRWLFEWLDRRIIRKSLLSLFTSEGFLQFHFGKQENYPANVILKPNKVNPKIKGIANVPKTAPNSQHLNFSFVGAIRYNSVYNMARIIATCFPQHEFHFYGEHSAPADEKRFKSLETLKNICFHGFFKNPDMLPEIYSKTDVVISTYDITSLNVRYAEPNKLYEALYFRTPIIVSKGTFLEKQVEKYHAGWAVDAMDEQSVCTLVKTIEREIIAVTEQMQKIPQDLAIDSHEALAKKLSELH